MGKSRGPEPERHESHDDDALIFEEWEDEVDESAGGDATLALQVPAHVAQSVRRTRELPAAALPPTTAGDDEASWLFDQDRPAKPKGSAPEPPPKRSGNEGQFADRSAFITVVAGPDKGKVFELAPNRVYLVGRSNADVNVADHSISRRHFKFYWDDGDLWIRDLGSTNGTAVNGRQVQGRIAVLAGEVVRVGESELAIGHEPFDVTDGEAPPTGLPGGSPSSAAAVVPADVETLDKVFRRLQGTVTDLKTAVDDAQRILTDAEMLLRSVKLKVVAGGPAGTTAGSTTVAPTRVPAATKKPVAPVKRPAEKPQGSAFDTMRVSQADVQRTIKERQKATDSELPVLPPLKRGAPPSAKFKPS